MRDSEIFPGFFRAPDKVNVTVEERRAPTDESVRLPRRQQNKRQHQQHMKTYRFLKPGEMIQEGDEWRSLIGPETWTPSSVCLGQTFTGICGHIRRPTSCNDQPLDAHVKQRLAHVEAQLQDRNKQAQHYFISLTNLSNFMSNITKTLNIPRAVPATGPQRHDIRLHADGHILHGLELVAAYDGERDKRGVLLSQGGIEWRTEKGKKLFLKYSEFSFLINHKEAA